MLTELRIRDFVIIKEQSLSLSSGLSVISGETGSGKSVLLQALEVLLGGRPKADFVREGAKSFEIEGLFDLSALSEEVRTELPDIIQESEELVLLRSMSASGKGRVYINGRLATVSVLEEIASQLVNICSQNSQLRLLQPKYHLNVLDDFGRHQSSLVQYQKHYQAFRTQERTYLELQEKFKKSTMRKAELEFVIEELSELELRSGLRSDLEEEIKKVSSSEFLLEKGQKILLSLQQHSGIQEQVAEILSDLHELEGLDSTLQPLTKLFQSAKTELGEFEGDFGSYLSSLSVDDERLASLREKLSELARIERKYQKTDTELKKLLESSKNEIALLEDASSLEELEKRACHTSKRSSWVC